MRKALAVAAMVAAGSSAGAQDFDWSGYYGGLSFGLGRSNANFNFPGTPFTGDHSGSGGVGAVQLGYNWVLSNGYVIGAEIDVAGGSVESSGPITDGSAEFERWVVNVSRSASVRAVVGRTRSDDWLVFGTLGATMAKGDGDIFGGPTGTVYRESYSQTFTGWTLGIGAERAFNKNMSIRGEIRHSSYGSELIDPPRTTPFNLEFETTEFRIGVNYHF